jgi:UDP-glucose 4-epimerase
VKRAFVTGASGFIGASLVKCLLASGVEVAVLQRGVQPGRRLKAIYQLLHQIDGVSQKPDDLRESLCRWAPDTVFHLGWAGVGNLHRNDAVMQYANVEFAIRLAETCVAAGVEHFVGAGSQAEYGPKRQAVRETDFTSPTTMYGAAKLAACVMTERVCELQGVRHSWLRVFSTYGPDDNPEWMLPTLIRKLAAGERPQLTAGGQLWDYLYVDDAGAAFAAVGEYRARGIYNLGSGNAISLRRVIETIRDQINPLLTLGFGDIPYRDDQVMHLEACVDKLKASTDWLPKISIEDGLQATIRWFGSSID